MLSKDPAQTKARSNEAAGQNNFDFHTNAVKVYGDLLPLEITWTR